MLHLDQWRPRNALLRRLGQSDRKLVHSRLRLVSLEARTVLAEPSSPLQYVDFIETGLVSVMASMGQQQVEVATIGFEGMTGVSIVHSCADAPHRMVFQTDGTVYRIRARELQRLMDESPSFRRLLLLYAHTLQIQMAHTAFVNARFTIEQRLARWILICQDKVGGVLPITHEFLAAILGSRRSGVTGAIHVLEGEQMIRARRGSIEVRDRPRLLAQAAGSYGLPEAEYDKTMSLTSMPDKPVQSGMAGKRILLVEDEYELAQEMREAFEGFGATIAGPVPNLEEAFLLLETSLDLDGAVVDINLQGELAFPLAEALRRRNVPFTFVSGYEHDIVPERFGDVTFYQKPVELNDIITSLSRAS